MEIHDRRSKENKGAKETEDKKKQGRRRMEEGDLKDSTLRETLHKLSRIKQLTICANTCYKINTCIDQLVIYIFQLFII